MAVSKIILKSGVVFCSILGLVLQTAQGQQTIRDSLFESIKLEVEPMVSASLSAIAYQPVEPYNFYVVDAVLNLKDETMEKGNRDVINGLKIKQLERDWGLVLRSQVNHNFNDYYLATDEITDQAYPTRFRVGIDLDLLKDGWLAHQNQAKRLANQKEIEWLEFDSKRNQERRFYRENVLVYFFNKEKIKLLEKRIETLGKELDMLYRVYYLKDILYEEVLKVKSELEQAQVQYKNFNDFNELVESMLNLRELPVPIDVNKLPLVDVDAHRLLRDSLFENRAAQIQALKNENNELEDSWVNNLTLKLQASENLALASSGGYDKLFPSIGLVAAVPVEAIVGSPTERQLNLAEEKYDEKFRKYEALNTSTEILNYEYEYRYKLKTYVQCLYKNMLLEEKLRIELLNRTRFTEYYQPFSMLDYYDQLNENRIEMLDLKQQLYLTLMRMNARTPLKSMRPYLYPVALNQYFVRLAGSRTIFVNKTDFNQFDRNFIDNYLRFNDFKYAVLSEPVVVDVNEQMEPVNLPKGSEIRFIQTVLWQPAMRYPEKAAADLVLKINKNGLTGFVLYLDDSAVDGIGPVRMSELRKQMADFMVEVNRSAPEMPIFLNIPSDFDLGSLSELGPWAQKIIVRLDTEADLAQLNNIPSKVLPFQKMPICISLDVNKFDNRLKMEAFINQVLKKYPLDDIIFNDFKSFVAMDTKLLSQLE